MIGKANYCVHNRSSWHHGSAGVGTAIGDCARYVLETGLCEVSAGDGAWRGTYRRQGIVRYILETEICELRAGDRDLRGTYWRQGVWRYVLETRICEVRTGDTDL
jgi:hypothetical protein